MQSSIANCAVVFFYVIKEYFSDLKLLEIRCYNYRIVNLEMSCLNSFALLSSMTCASSFDSLLNDSAFDIFTADEKKLISPDLVCL